MTFRVGQYAPRIAIRILENLSKENPSLGLFHRIFGKNPPPKGPKVVFVSDKQMKEMCDRNFERILQEISTKAKESAKTPSSTSSKVN